MSRPADAPQDMLRLIALRALTANARRAEGKHSAHPVAWDMAFVPAYLREPEQLPDAENGYLVAQVAAENIRMNGMTDCDLSHRAIALLTSRSLTECEAADRALKKFEIGLAQVEHALCLPKWQCPTPEGGVACPELNALRSLGNAFVLRGALRAVRADPEGSAADLLSACRLSRKIRNCQGFLLHHVVGLALDAQVQRVLRAVLRSPHLGAVALPACRELSEEDRVEELRQAYIHEFGRVGIPRATRTRGPWEEVARDAPVHYQISHYLAQWLLNGHSCAYDPEATAEELVVIAESFVAWVDLGWPAAEAMEAMRAQYIGDWPEGMTRVSLDRLVISGRQIKETRLLLRSVDNAHGMLQCARLMHASSEVFRASTLATLRLAGTQIMAARFQLGRAPVCLDELVGCGLIASVPEDPFTQAPVLMNEKDQAIWSPGPCDLPYEEVKRCFGRSPDTPYYVRL